MVFVKHSLYKLHYPLFLLLLLAKFLCLYFELSNSRLRVISLLLQAFKLDCTKVSLVDSYVMKADMIGKLVVKIYLVVGVAIATAAVPVIVVEYQVRFDEED